MSLPNTKGVTTIIKNCCANIGLTFTDDPDNEKLLAFSTDALVKQIRDSSGTTWDAAVEAFSGLIQLRFIKRGCVVTEFDETWFDQNKGKVVADLVEDLRANAVEI